MGLDSDLSCSALQRCLTLAQRAGARDVKNNPQVGAIIVYKDRIIGEGWHRNYGGPHAEREAIDNVKEVDRQLLSQSHLFVSLEPCNHYGKTPPCTEAILENKIPLVTIGALDPSSRMSGKSVEHLRSKGVKVEVISNDKLFKNLIQPFYTHLVDSRPYIVLKFAISKDGFIGKENETIQLSNHLSSIYTHQLRRDADGILVGTNTAITDNPKLTTRSVDGPSPKRFIVDRNRRIPTEHQLLSDENETYILTTDEYYPTHDQCRAIQIRKEQWNTENILGAIYQQGAYRLLVEGGAQLLRSIIDTDQWDECHLICTPRYLGEGIKAPYIRGEMVQKYKLLEDKVFVIRQL